MYNVRGYILFCNDFKAFGRVFKRRRRGREGKQVKGKGKKQGKREGKKEIGKGKE